MLFQILISAISSSLVVLFPRAMQCCSDGSESPRYEQTKYSDRQVEKRQRERAHMAGTIPETTWLVSNQGACTTIRGHLCEGYYTLRCKTKELKYDVELFIYTFNRVQCTWVLVHHDKASFPSPIPKLVAHTCWLAKHEEIMLGGYTNTTQHEYDVYSSMGIMCHAHCPPVQVHEIGPFVGFCITGGSQRLRPPATAGGP